LEPAGVLNTGNITDQKFTAHPWSIFWTAYPLDVKQLERGAPGNGGMELASADPGFHRFSLVSRRRVCRVRPQHISCRAPAKAGAPAASAMIVAQTGGRFQPRTRLIRAKRATPTAIC
jgi:hypothetical protein